MQNLSNFLSSNPYIIIVIALASLWPIIRVLVNATGDLLSKIGVIFGSDIQKLQQLSDDIVLFVSSQLLSAWTLVFIEIIVYTMRLTFPSFEKIPIVNTEGWMWAVGGFYMLLRVTQAAVLANAAASAYGVRYIRLRRL